MPVKNKVFCIYPRKTDATSWFRGAGVMGELVREGIEISDDVQVSWAELVAKDAVFFQRPFVEKQRKVINIIKVNNKPVIVDYDDLLMGVPESNNFHKVCKEYDYEKHFKDILNVADGVILSTQYMKDYLIKEGVVKRDNIRVIRNCFNDYTFDFKKNFSNFNKMVLWRGSITHEVDFEEYKEAIKRIIEDNNDFTFVFFGYLPHFLKDYQNIIYKKQTDIIMYMHEMRMLQPSIVFTPLKDIPFNRSKSNIAKIEATASGAVALSMAFDEWVWNEDDRYYFNETSFETKMNDVIERVRNKDKTIEDEYNFNYQYIKDNLLLSNVNIERKKFIQEVIDGYTPVKNLTF